MRPAANTPGSANSTASRPLLVTPPPVTPPVTPPVVMPPAAAVTVPEAAAAKASEAFMVDALAALAGRKVLQLEHGGRSGQAAAADGAPIASTAAWQPPAKGWRGSGQS